VPIPDSCTAANGISIRSLGQRGWAGAAVPYLKLCFQRLQESAGAFFVYGSSVNDNDAHIYNALFRSKISHLYSVTMQERISICATIDGEYRKYLALTTDCPI
jgi:hypothetical protein